MSLNIKNISEEEKSTCIHNMVSNLPALRAVLHLNQEDLANLVGVSRQHLALVENGSRKLTWQLYLSLMFVFIQNKETQYFLDKLEIFPTKLRNVYDIENSKEKYYL